MNSEKKSNKSIYAPLGASNHSQYERGKLDYYATHPSAVPDLLKYESFQEQIWEPACGECHLVKPLREAGHEVYATDIVDRGFNDDTFDFLKQERQWHGDIVTNPPYKYADKFVNKAMESIQEGGKVAMFLKLTFLESQKRKKLFDKYPPKFIYVYRKRQRVAKNGDSRMFQKSSAVCYAWFIWSRGFGGEPVIRWIE